MGKIMLNSFLCIIISSSIIIVVVLTDTLKCFAFGRDVNLEIFRSATEKLRQAEAQFNATGF